MQAKHPYTQDPSCPDSLLPDPVICVCCDKCHLQGSKDLKLEVHPRTEKERQELSSGFTDLQAAPPQRINQLALHFPLLAAEARDSRPQSHQLTTF
ncbi:hypothetical protein LEMLEM_LOCUS4147, partial [Lemmus lemmus]